MRSTTDPISTVLLYICLPPMPVFSCVSPIFISLRLIDCLLVLGRTDSVQLWRFLGCVSRQVSPVASLWQTYRHRSRGASRPALQSELSCAAHLLIDW